jgi:hypothetical protein
VKQKVQPGAEFDFVTPGEMAEHLNRITRESAQEAARGVAVWRDWSAADVAGGDVLVPPVGSDPFGVDVGMAVFVQTARAAGLATNDTLLIYRNTVADPNFIGQLTAAAPVLRFGGKGLVLKGSEKLLFSGSALTATTITVNAEGIMVPETDLYKLADS